MGLAIINFPSNWVQILLIGQVLTLAALDNTCYEVFKIIDKGTFKEFLKNKLV